MKHILTGRAPARSVVLRHLPALVLLSLPFLAPRAAQASDTYSVKPIATIGHKAGSLELPFWPDYRFYVGNLTDNGQIAFGVGTSLANRFYQGSYNSTGKADWLIHYAKGKFTPIVAPRTEDPSGNWPSDVSVLWPFGMNRSGNVAFAAGTGTNKVLGTFLWNAKEGRSITVAQQGMPAPDGGRSLTFNQAGGFGTAINNSDDMVLIATIKDPNGPDGPGLFFNGRDGKMLPILLPGQVLPGGAKISATYFAQPSINDSGRVAFLARRQNESQTSAYLWHAGSITPMVSLGAAAQPGFKVSRVTGVYLNSRNDDALVTAYTVPTAGTATTQHGVYRLVDGVLFPVAVPGMQMQGGGKFRSVQNILSASAFASSYDQATICLGISPASRLGEHIILATLEDRTTAAYRMDVRGRLWPVLKSGTVVRNLGTISQVGVDSPASINQSGQIALTVRINGGAPTLVLLQPAS